MTTARTRCLNCSLMLTKFIRRHILAEIPDNILTILQAWITPTALSNEDVVCDICYTLLQEANVSQEPATPAVGHTRVCYVCGVSVLRSRTHKVPLDSPQRNHILEWVPPHQINRLERVCRACWMAATRAVQRQQLQDAQRLDNSPVLKVLPQEQIKVEINIPAPPRLPEIQVIAPIPPEELKVCIVCLAVNIKMYDMKDFKLSEKFHNITGKSACNEKEGALLRICWECAARLTAAAAFREKALLSDSLLKDLVYVSKNHIAVLKRLNHSSLKSSLTVQTVFTSSEIGCGDAVSETKEDEYFSDETDINEVKTELKINLEEKENGFDEKDDVSDIEVDDIGGGKETDIELENSAEETETDFEEDDIREGKETDIELEDNIEETDFEEDDIGEEKETDIEEDDIGEEKETDIEEDDIGEGKETDIRLKDIIEEKETDLEEEEPLIEFLMKTEVESDPIAENNFNVQMQVVKNEFFFELEHFDDDFMSPNEDNDDKIENTEIQVSNNDKILTEDTPMTINDGDIVLLEDNVGGKPKVVVIGNILNDTANEGDIQPLPEPVAVNKVKKKKISPNRLIDTEKQKIIALKAKGLSNSEIAEETGKSITCITAWWQRYSQEDSEITEETIPDTIEEPDQNICEDLVEPGRNFVACSPTVRRRLYQAGLEHILMKKPGVVNTEKKVSKFTAKYNNLKQQIIALKQEGLSNSRIAYLLETSTNMIRRWWKRWCNEGHLNSRKRTGRRKMTSAQEDQLLIERVLRDQTVHTPSLARQFGISPR